MQEKVRYVGLDVHAESIVIAVAPSPVWVPDEQTEALRDLEQSLEDARLADYVHTAQQATERVQRLTGQIAGYVSTWALAPLVRNFQAFHGIQLVTAVGLSAEIGNFARFEKFPTRLSLLWHASWLVSCGPPPMRWPVPVFQHPAISAVNY